MNIINIWRGVLMELTQLEYFMTVAQLEHMTLASKNSVLLSQR